MEIISSSRLLIALGAVLLGLTSTEVISSHGKRGLDVAKNINDRFYNFKEICPDNKPAHYCSGVINRTGGDYDMTTGNGYPSWSIGPEYQQNGSGSFSFISSYIFKGNDAIWHESGKGLIVKPLAEALNESKPYYARCLWPANGWPEARENYGCGNMKPVNSSKAFWDNSTCSNDNYKSQEWVEDTIKEYGSLGMLGMVPNMYCSYSTEDAKSFVFALEVQSSLSAMNKNNNFNEFLLAVKNETGIGEEHTLGWSTENPKENAIEAFWFLYEPGDDADVIKTRLHYAQSDQRLFFEKTGQIVPILRMNRYAASSLKMLYTYEEADQLISVDEDVY